MDTIVKIHYQHPDRGRNYFNLDTDGSVTNSSLPGLDNGDHLLFLDKLDCRGLTNQQIYASYIIIPKKWTHITVLRAQNFHEELLR